MKPPKPQDLLVAVLPTTVGGTTIEAKASWFPHWQEKAYNLLLRINYPSGGSADGGFVKLEVAKSFSFKKLQALAAGCLLRDDVRQAIHRLCSEHGLTLINPVF